MQILQLYLQKYPCICENVFSRNRPLKLVFTNLEPKDVSDMNHDFIKKKKKDRPYSHPKARFMDLWIKDYRSKKLSKFCQ